ncbi:MAG: hypothetical protein FJ221_02555 [Lentisphaerae bacterium]|nr:hypothetical protein [Lentisphaerota bacterium]
MIGFRTACACLAALALDGAARAADAATTNAPAAPPAVAGAVDYAKLDWRNELFMLDGKPFNGTAEQRHREGKLKARYRYLDGKIHGLVEEWYANGQKSTETNFENNQRHGANTYWDQAGKVIKKQRWEHDKLVESSDPHEVEGKP